MAIFTSAPLAQTVPAAPAVRWIGGLETDRALYAPGDTVRVTLTFDSLPSAGELSYRWYHLGDTVASGRIPLDGSRTVTWSWLPPPVDFVGYLLSVGLQINGTESGRAAIAVDVSSSWTRYPRYGFLSSFPRMGGEEIGKVVSSLNRHHINGVQFYDWQYKHHLPLKGSAAAPAAQWKDIANRDVYYSTVRGYIDELHRRGMKAMSYNLLYGAYADAAADGVDTAGWALYKDPHRRTRFMYTLPAGWAGNLIFMNPADTAWQDYLYRREEEMFRALPFDGWHVDQVGDNGVMYDARGLETSVKAGFTPFLRGAKAALNVPLVMNAVNQYGQEEIARAPVEFLYTEVWDCAVTYRDLQALIESNRRLSGGHSSSVLAAYMNYDRSGGKGLFNDPGVLLAEAVIMASGGTHIALGEHMLAHEYFPNDNLRMTPALQSRMQAYYDFSVAYESILRGEGALRSASAHSAAADSTSALSAIALVDTSLFSPSGRAGAVWSFVREIPASPGTTEAPGGPGRRDSLGTSGNSGEAGRRQMDVLHLINLAGVSNLEWRDRAGTQVDPVPAEDLQFSFETAKPVAGIWSASPDLEGGVPRQLHFTRSGSRISVTLPRLEYWCMVVVEYGR